MRLKSWQITLYLLLVLLSSVVLIILSISQDFRYLYANYPVAILFLGGLFMPLRLARDDS